ncbi:hypothetical protein QU481_18635 [Crenobacter sp. SG2303]|uniref:Prepilin type IV endopeptidase peptidase domain-containing protein n=1 Tax=Crenobacter oryzisoli TaxID=3056844 RepID=A0ABT7XT16_9NEIS|nr:MULTISPECIES: hypothetical protein [unclassified Crenobacter]MDN0076865.1 hypothetical protein [Crenobacter sp. SG2303]MDN0082017.1 hypothetical protein [Crenobacter sp. SG2305]
MSITAVVLFSVVALFLLHGLWRVLVSGSGVAAASLAASYWLIAIPFKLMLPDLPLTPIWLPFLYPYALMAMAALLWLVCYGRFSRLGISFPEAPPLLSAYFLAQLTMLVGFVVLAWLFSWRTLLAYGTLPPLLCGMSYIAYRCFAFRLQEQASASYSWHWLGSGALMAPVVVVVSGDWLVPVLLDYL